jgi:steroid delta-isomerase
MSPELISRGIAEYFAAIRSMDQERFVNSFSEDAVSHDPVGAPPIVGHQKLGEFFQAITGAFKEVSLVEEQIFIAGNGAAVKWLGTGISKQGRKVRFEGIDVLEFSESGKIKNLRAYWNPAEMTAQL